MYFLLLLLYVSSLRTTVQLSSSTIIAIDTTCYSCFGAEDQVQPDKDGRRCCNTCEALLEAYNKKMWSKETILRDAPIVFVTSRL